MAGHSALVINEKDNVAVALLDIAAGEEIRLVGGGVIVAASEVPYGHKLALRRIPVGEALRKYGESIGRASRVIEAGEWVHTHNIKEA